MSVPTWASVIIAIGAAAVLALSADQIFHRLMRPPFRPAGKHCFITGGSTGLGKALAIELVKQGANVTIVARRQAELEKAAQEIQVNKVNEQQRVVVVSADVTVAENVVRAFDEAKIKMGRDPDMIFACAGAAFPKQFLDHSMQDFEYLARLNYLGQAYVAHQAATRMRDSGIKDGKIVFVSSMMGLLGFAGYSAYAPTKFALRGLADCLRNELKQYGIGVHIFFPGNIDSPGFENENRTKPEVTRAIEGASTPVSPESCAKSLIHGLKAGYYMITNEFIAEVLRSSARGVNPANNFFVDSLLALIAQPVGSIYALFMDYMVKRYGSQ